MPQGPNAISLNQCCCGEDVGCLEDVCFVTVEFRNVKNPVVVPDEGEQLGCPPDLGLGCNDPAQGENDQPTDPQPVCTDCNDWNREWELVLLPEGGKPDQKLGDGSTDFKFILGQERDKEFEGYSDEQFGAYDLPGGSTCFPCADINDDTGMTLVINCLGKDDDGNDLISIDLTLRVEGCQLAIWDWQIYRPNIFNSDRSRGVPRPASLINRDFEAGFQGQPGQDCYTPSGLCKVDPEGAVFPCDWADNESDAIATFYDRQNCYWSNEDIDKPQVRFYLCESTTGVDNPDECDVCTNETIVFDSKPDGTDDFGSFGIGLATEISPYDQPGVDAINDHVWRLESSLTNDRAQVRVESADICPNPGPPDIAVCTYEVFIRYGRNTSTFSEGIVSIYTTDPGSGPAFDLTTGGVTWDSLPLATDDLDGDHNTDQLTINGVAYKFYKVGRFLAACDAEITIEVSGPRDETQSIDFDAIVLKRL